MNKPEFDPHRLDPVDTKRPIAVIELLPIELSVLGLGKAFTQIIRKNLKKNLKITLKKNFNLQDISYP